MQQGGKDPITNNGVRKATGGSNSAKIFLSSGWILWTKLAMKSCWGKGKVSKLRIRNHREGILGNKKAKNDDSGEQRVGLRHGRTTGDAAP